MGKDQAEKPFKGQIFLITKSRDLRKECFNRKVGEEIALWFNSPTFNLACICKNQMQNFSRMFRLLDFPNPKKPKIVNYMYVFFPKSIFPGPTLSFYNDHNK